MKFTRIPALTDIQQIRFWSRVNIGDPKDCWEWTGHIATTGYGCVDFQVTKKKHLTLKAHRVAYFLANHSDPGNLLVRHQCHQKRCCNPAHLLLGTHQENADDNVRDGLLRQRLPRKEFLVPVVTLPDGTYAIDLGDLT